MEAWNNTVAAEGAEGGLFLHVLLGVSRRDVEMVSGMGWSVAISCFCEMGEVDTEPCCAVMFFCFFASGMGRLMKYMESALHSHAFQKTGRTFSYEGCNQKCCVALLNCTSVGVGRCARCSALSTWASKRRLQLFSVYAAVSVFRPLFTHVYVCFSKGFFF